MTRAVLLLGGNLGPVAENIQRARAMLATEAGTLYRCTSVQESEAWGFDTPERFLNQVVVIETELEPLQLLDTMLAIETSLGRVRTPAAAGGPRYRSRTMDIDLLYYGERQIHSPRLTVPHPLIGEREFVQVLLHELDLPAILQPPSPSSKG